MSHGVFKRTFNIILHNVEAWHGGDLILVLFILLIAHSSSVALSRCLKYKKNTKFNKLYPLNFGIIIILFSQI